MGEFGIPRRRFFIKGSDYNRTHHIHIFQTGDTHIKRHLNFRNYLVAHHEEAKAYSHLKEELARQFTEDIEGYMEGKSSFIEEIDRKAKIFLQEAVSLLFIKIKIYFQWIFHHNHPSHVKHLII